MTFDFYYHFLSDDLDFDLKSHFKGPFTFNISSISNMIMVSVS